MGDIVSLGNLAEDVTPFIVGEVGCLLHFCLLGGVRNEETIYPALSDSSSAAFSHRLR